MDYPLELLYELATPDYGGFVVEARSFATPAAGAEVSIVVPGGEVWLVLAMSAQLVTSAVVANRAPSVVLDDGTRVMYRFGSGAAIPASTTTQVTAASDAVSQSSVAGLGVVMALPAAAVLTAGWRMRTITQLIDVGDQYSAVTAWLVVCKLGDTMLEAWRHRSERRFEAGEPFHPSMPT